MAYSDAFALKNSGLNEFLFAEVGIDINNSPLTILSMLARLGKDPWTEAARMARLAKQAAIDDLAGSISQMPLSPQALLDTRTTAARLVLLLPAHVEAISEQKSRPSAKLAVPRWIPVAVCCAALALGIAFQLMPAAKPTGVSAPIGDTIKPIQAPTN